MGLRDFLKGKPSSRPAPVWNPPEYHQYGADPFAGMALEFMPELGTHPRYANLPDVSLESPDAQFAALVELIETDDAAHPAPFTGTPPWTEGINAGEIMVQPETVPPPDLEAPATTDILALTRDPFPAEYPVVHWENDDQYHGLGVPPGPPNTDQPVESGHTQIIRNNPAAEAGWDAWSGRTPMARVARHENMFTGYSADVNRGHGVVPIKLEMPYALLTQQYRDLLLAELKRRGVHNVVVADVPSVPFTEQVAVTDPTILAPEAPIGAEGLLPSDDEYFGGVR